MHTPHKPPAGPVVFLSEPMDRARGLSRDGSVIARELADCGLTVYRPATTWSGGQHHPVLVEDINRKALNSADCVVADFRSGAPTIGVPMEIEWARAHDIPVVAVWPEGHPLSVSLLAAGVHWADGNADAVARASDLAVRHWRLARANYQDRPSYLRVVLSDPDAPAPQQAYGDDAGYDLVTDETVVIPPHTFADVPSTVVGIQPPRGTWGLIVGRSSTLRKRGLLVNSGVIDYGWRGPLFAGVFNLTGDPVIVNKGERLAQYILIPTVESHLTQVDGHDALAHHPRGLAGFGSSGGHGQADTHQANPVHVATATPPGGNSLGAFTG